MKRILPLGLLLLFACDEELSPSGEVDQELVDLSPLPDAFKPPPILDAASLPDAGAFGAPCESGRDCLSGFCVEGLEGGRICTMTCGECPEGYECNFVRNSGADVTFICVPDKPDLCKICDSDLDCNDQEDLCLNIGLGSYCAADCAENGSCPDGYECSEIPGEGSSLYQCLPVSGSCAPCQDEDGDGYGEGADCLGFDCNDEDERVHEGAEERCDGLDNNCNSLSDEEEALPPPPDGLFCIQMGICQGSTLSCMEGEWRCAYPEGYEPDLEQSCDGVDNDCDGSADEDFNFSEDVEHCGFCSNACGFPHSQALCLEGVCALGECEAGWHNLDAIDGNGCEYQCSITQEGQEACDLIDNNCNGLVDEGFELETHPEHCGACNRACSPPHAEPGCQAGECAIARCEEGWHDANSNPLDGCEYPCEPSGDEICDALDNDCDGFVDEDYDLLTDMNHCGGCDRSCGFPHAQAECSGGVCHFQECDLGYVDSNHNLEDGCEYACVISHGGEEVCDLIDNDCNSLVDEGFNLSQNAEHCGECNHRCLFPNGEASCIDAQCQLTGCVEGFWDIDERQDNGCEYACTPADDPEELCNQRDDDCDGEIDEEFNLTRDIEHCGRCRHSCELENAIPRCSGGECFIRECVGGFHDIDGRASNGCEYACQPTHEGEEICDDLDNDCDGEFDDGFDFSNDLLHCGGCNQPCEAGNGVMICDRGRCVFSGCEPGFWDIDGREENGCEYACDFEADGDLPDPEGRDSNCDGIDGDRQAAIFVAPDGSLFGTGTDRDPVRQINAAIDLALEQGFEQVIISQGIYEESVLLSSGISLYGGYDRNASWRRSIEGHETRIQGRPVALTGESLRHETRVQGLRLQVGAVEGVGESSVAIYLTDIPPDILHLEYLQASSGAGNRGQDGADGGGGNDGQQGVRGEDGCDGCSGNGGGGRGGASFCRNPGGGGGRGGYNDERGANGTAGTGPGGGGGDGGSSAGGLYIPGVSNCSRSGAGSNGSNGDSGERGVDGARGEGGLLRNGAWRGVDGASGTRGSAGGGGGGGGGGGCGG